MTEIERMVFLLDALENGSQQSFADKTGLSIFAVSRLVNGKTHIKKHIPTILAAYPEVDETWLYSGEGYPGDISLPVVLKRYRAIIEAKDREIASLKQQIKALQK